MLLSVFDGKSGVDYLAFQRFVRSMSFVCASCAMRFLLNFRTDEEDRKVGRSLLGETLRIYARKRHNNESTFRQRRC